ncbi:MAG: hypothetical protein WBC13_04660 [Dokdonella sp.]
MGKFVLSEIKKRIEEKALGLKVAAQFKLAGGMSLVMDKMFAFYKMGLNGYASGNPTTKDKWLIKYVVIPAIDKKYNSLAIERLKLIVEKPVPTKEDISFIKEEVIPYFDDNCKRLTGKELAMIGLPTSEEFSVFETKINKEVSKGKKIDSSVSKKAVEDMTGATKIR